MISISPAELDQQSRVKVARWIDIESEECDNMDSHPDFTRKCLRVGVEGGFMVVDALGRIWGRGSGGYMYPFHFEYGSSLYGYRISVVALN